MRRVWHSMDNWEMSISQEGEEMGVGKWRCKFEFHNGQCKQVEMCNWKISFSISSLGITKMKIWTYHRPFQITRKVDLDDLPSFMYPIT